MIRPEALCHVCCEADPPLPFCQALLQLEVYRRMALLLMLCCVHIQTAAGSVLGRMVIALAKRSGVKTINVVRRSAQKQELLDIG